MVGGLTILLLFQLVGELIATGFNLPVPGPVIGMGLLFVALLARGGAKRRAQGGSAPPPAPDVRLPSPLGRGAGGEGAAAPEQGEGLDRAAQALLNHLSLLFIPAGCGIITYVSLIREEWLPITVSLVGSTLITIAVTALTMQALLRRQNGRQGAEQDGR